MSMTILDKSSEIAHGVAAIAEGGGTASQTVSCVYGLKKYLRPP